MLGVLCSGASLRMRSRARDIQAINSTREAAKPVAECTDNTVELVVSSTVDSAN